MRSKKRSAANSPPREPLVLFLDESFGNKLVPAALRAEGLTVVCHHEHFSPGEADSVWLTEVARQGWVALTKDDRIRYRAHEIEPALKAGIRLFVHTGGNLRAEEVARSLVIAMPRIRRVVDRVPPPLVARVTRAGGVEVVYPIGRRSGSR